jgi:hypothetical protein
MPNATLVPGRGNHGMWKQHPDEKDAQKLFDSLSHQDKGSLMDDLVLGVGIDWLDFDIPKPSKIFRRYFYRLLEEYDQEM